MSIISRLFKKASPPQAQPASRPAPAPRSAQQPASALEPTSHENPLGQVQSIVAIASGKGGVGKSTSAVHLAYSLAGMGFRVGLIDADIYGPSLAVMTGVGKPTAMQGQLVVPPLHNGIKMISVAMFASAQSAQIMRGPMAGNMVKQFFTNVAWGELDYLLIDYPPGTGDIQLTISQVASLTAAVLITSPQEVALADVRKAVSMFTTLKVPLLGIIETMSYFVCDQCDKKHFIFEHDGGKKLATECGIPLLGQIPLSAALTTAADKGKPLVLSQPENPISRAFSEAAEQIADELDALARQSSLALGSFSLQWRQES